MSYDPSNVFAQIIQGKLDTKKVFENEHTIAIWDRNPQAPIHILIIPKGAYETFQAFIEIASEVEKNSFFSAIMYIIEYFKLGKSGYRMIINQGANGGQIVHHMHAHILGGAKLGSKIINSPLEYIE